MAWGFIAVQSELKGQLLESVKVAQRSGRHIAVCVVWPYVTYLVVKWFVGGKPFRDHVQILVPGWSLPLAATGTAVQEFVCPDL